MNPQAIRLRADPNRTALGGIIALLDGMEALTRSGITGLVPSNGVDATNDINITAGACRNAANDGLIQTPDAWIKALDAEWVLGSGAGVGGLANGLTASNTTYHLHMLGSSHNRKAVDFIFDTSVTCANGLADADVIAAGFDRYRRCFSFYRTGGANVTFYAKERAGGGLIVRLLTPVLSFSKDWTGADDTLQSGVVQVPVGIGAIAICGWVFYDATPAAASALKVISQGQSPSITVSAALGSYNGDLWLAQRTDGQESQASGRIESEVGSSGQVFYKTGGSTVDHFVSVSTEGWIDERRS